MVKIGPVTAKILAIWTNVANTNIAWTNVCDSWDMFKNVSNLVEIRPVTAEILPIWTNVARTIVAWANDYLTIVLDCQEICRQDKCCVDKCHLTVGICSRCSQEPIFKV